MEDALEGVEPRVDRPGIPPTRWYSRAAVDEFVATAEREQVRLEATIADARLRLERATSAVSLRQTMIGMILEVQREVAEVRREAEAQSGEIIAAGRLEADAIMRAAPSRTNGNGKLNSPGATTVATVDAPPASASVPPLESEPRVRSDDEAFFSYLRSELDKDEPLGPWQP